MSKSLPSRPNVEHLRTQAKDLLSAFRSGDSNAQMRFAGSLPSFSSGFARSLALRDAQSVIAREYGFSSWAKLTAYVENVRAAQEGITDETIAKFVRLALDGRADRLRRLLELHPTLPEAQPVCALVSGEWETVREWITADPARIGAKLAPNDWDPLAYICFSRIDRALPERSESLRETVRLLLDQGADPNAFTLFNGNADVRLPVLYGACGVVGNIEIARLLLEKGANPNDGESIFHAAEHNRREIMALLTEFGADITNAHAGWRNTPIYFLCAWRESDPNVATTLAGMEWLLENGADPNIFCPCTENNADVMQEIGQEARETALHRVCRNGRGPAVIELLLRYGADPSLRRPHDGRSAYDLACITGNDAAAETLRRHGADTSLKESDVLLAAAVLGDTEAARAAMAAPGANPALLCRLAEFGETKGVRALVTAGVDVATRGEEGGTPLHFACYCGQTETVRALLDLGAPIDLRDNTYNSTPMGWALQAAAFHRNPNGDYPAIVRWLWEAGATEEETRWFLDYEDAPEDVAAVIREMAGV